MAKRIAVGIELNSRPLPDRDRDAILELAGEDPDHVYREGGNWVWLAPDGTAGIMCPDCWNGGGGTLVPIQMTGSDERFYLCFEWNGLWHVEQFDWDNPNAGSLSLSDELDQRGLTYDDIVELPTWNPGDPLAFGHEARVGRQDAG